jgi:hypothetical protein
MKKKKFIGPIHFILLHFETLKSIIKLTQVSPKVAKIVVTLFPKRGRGAKYFWKFLIKKRNLWQIYCVIFLAISPQTSPNKKKKGSVGIWGNTNLVLVQCYIDLYTRYIYLFHTSEKSVLVPIVRLDWYESFLKVPKYQYYLSIVFI